MDFRRLALGLGAVLALALAGAGVAVLLRDQRTATMADDAASAEDLEGARIAIVDRFPDAEEVAFGKAFLHGESEARAVCGYVDVKQTDDGFDGEERFVFVLGQLMLEETEGSDALTQRWKDVCEG